MTRLIAVISLSLAVLLQSTADSRAQSYPRARCPADLDHHVPQQYYPWNYGHYRNPYDYYRDLYPKYYYGRIHARHFYDLGFPSGEVRLRGTPW